MGAWSNTINHHKINFLPIYLVFPLALSALELEDKLLGCLGLLPQDRFGLTTESLLLAVISDILRSQDLLITFLSSLNISFSPPSSLSLLGLGWLLILGHLELLVGLALGVRAIGVAPLGEVHHPEQMTLNGLCKLSQLSKCQSNFFNLITGWLICLKPHYRIKSTFQHCTVPIFFPTCC